MGIAMPILAEAGGRLLTVLAPSERYNQGQGKKHKKLTD
jgi:hypothetical protein